MDVRVVGFFHLLERVTAMPRLAAGFASGFLTQAARSGFFEPIAGGRFAAVGAVKGELPLEFNDLGFLCEDHLRRLIGPAANHLQDLFEPALQLAHNASRKSLRRG